MKKESLKAAVDAVERLLSLEPRSRVLDLACGHGRTTLEIARRGHRVLGLDADGGGFSHAREAARDERLNVHFMKADPRAIPYRGDLDAIVSFGAAFENLSGERGDLRALESARKALKPGAKLLLELTNRERLMRHLPAHAHFDFEKGRHGGARVYALTEMIALIERAGLIYRRAWGGFEHEPFGLDSAGLVVLAERPREERPARRVDDGLPSAIRIKGRR